jgi:hypothetical protein
VTLALFDVLAVALKHNGRIAVPSHCCHGPGAGSCLDQIRGPRMSSYVAVNIEIHLLLHPLKPAIQRVVISRIAIGIPK